MNRTLSFLFILALCALSWAAIGYGAVLLVRWLGYPIGLSVITAVALCVVGFISHEIRNSADAGD